ncbi:hypothetical protein [Dactylosporangium sp. CS-033363]|uniref:hypothetical protein n=1 Tax=Dactylosporangium sp. CS-033363 TaxID=3239935 RepID=UPI003D8B3984
MSLVADLVSVAGSFDRAFVTWRANGPAPATAAALTAFWELPQAAPLRTVAARPPLDWDELVEAWLDLEAGGGEPAVDWAGLGGVPGEPVAAAVVSVFALAGWAGGLGEALLRFPPDEGWFLVPARAAHTLLAADAVHAAEFVVGRARAVVDEGAREFYAPAVQERLVGLREAALGIARRRDEDVAGLAWELRAACRAGGPNLRAEVAALLWTVGDVPRADLLARAPDYTPPLTVLQQLVATTMAWVRDDPLLQYVWLELKDRPPLDLRRHHRLFALLNARYTHNVLHHLDVSAAYARALVAHFGAGPAADLVDSFGLELATAIPILGADEPLSQLRLAALDHLLLGGDPDRWRELAGAASAILGDAVRRGDFTALHRCLAVPLYYVDGDALAAVERHRAAGLAYWLAAAPPPPTLVAEQAEPLRAEMGLLEQLRGARYVRLTPQLPPAYQRMVTDLRASIRRGEVGVHPLDQERAVRLTAQAWRELGALWERMRELDPSYVDARTDPVADLDTFAAALTATTPGTRPIGPFPVRRTNPDEALFDEPSLDEPSLDEPDGLGRLEQRGMERAVRYLQGGDGADIAAAIADHEAAADLADAGGVPLLRRVEARFNAGVTRHHRYGRTGDLGDLRRAIEHWRAVMRMPDVPAERAVVVADRLVDALLDLHRRTGDAAPRAEAGALRRAAADAASPADPNAAQRLAALGMELLADPSTAGEAADVLRRAAAAARRSDPRNLVPILNNLAIALLTGGGAAELDEAVAALDEAATTAPIGPLRVRLLLGLADLLDRRGGPEDAARAAAARERAAELLDG